MYHGKEVHCRAVTGTRQACWIIFQKATSTLVTYQVWTLLLHNQAVKFVKETVHLRSNGRNILTVMSCYRDQSCYRTLLYLFSNGWCVINLQFREWHILQLLDIIIFETFKSHIQRLVRALRVSVNLRWMPLMLLISFLMPWSFHTLWKILEMDSISLGCGTVQLVVHVRYFWNVSWLQLWKQ